MSTVDSQIHLPPPVERRRRQTPEIIDLDELDTDDIVFVGSTRPNQRRRIEEDGRAASVTREVIDVTDDEDDGEIQFVGHNPARPQPPLVARARLFSPPPPPQIGGIPPVPRIPERFMPLRPRPPPGLVIPNEDPFPFEADLRPLPPAEQPPPVAASPSHHVPPMGFGGALLAGVRRIIGPRSNSHRSERRNGWGMSGSFIMRWDLLDLPGGQGDDLLDQDEIGLFGEGDNHFGAGRMRSQLEQAFEQQDREGRAEPDYKPHYTHPDRPLPGFTHDFSPASTSSPVSEENDTSPARRASGSRTRTCEVTLVCASCRDPLVLGASDVGEGRAKRKLWGLRCGHLLDGKCIERLMEPTPQNSDAGGSSRTTVDVESAEHSSSQSQVTDFSAGSMRSRLRPRRMPGSPHHPVPTTISHGRRGGSSRTKAPQRSNRKGKGKMKAPVVEAEHEWSCPVSGCGRVHLSLLMDGRWTLDEKRGAIAVFV